MTPTRGRAALETTMSPQSFPLEPRRGDGEPRHLARRAAPICCAAQAPRWRACTPPTASRTRHRSDPRLEFYAEAGAPEGALYLDGQLIGWLPG